MQFTKEKLASILDSHTRWLSSGGQVGSRANLIGAYLRGADLSGADLRGANLSGADLRGANLSGADLRGADLSGADLIEANLSGADLRGADLIGAYLIGADLREADLREANLSGADLREANLILIGQDIRGYCFWAYQNNANAVVVRAGCRCFSLAEAKAHWESRHLGDPVLHEDCISLIARAERMARARGWIIQPQTSPVLAHKAP